MFRVPLFDDEIITSFCSRLAAANGITATDFCRDMGFTFQSHQWRGQRDTRAL
jgi:hypothetical protein